jgi:hypothetical protein
MITTKYDTFTHLALCNGTIVCEIIIQRNLNIFLNVREEGLEWSDPNLKSKGDSVTPRGLE